MANNVSTQVRENPRLQKMPVDQREWQHFINEMAKWVTDLDTTGRLTSDRILPQVILANAGSVQESLPITATDAGSSVTINVSAHTLARQTGDVSYSAGSITGLAYDTTYYVYADDPDYEGGSVTYLTTTDKGDIVGSIGRYLVGEVISPAATEADRTGAPGAGTTMFNEDIFLTGVKASTTKEGIIKAAEAASVNTGTATDEAVTPDALSNSDYIKLADIPSADDTTEGIVELATTAEVDAGAATDRAVTPDALDGSIYDIVDASPTYTVTNGATDRGFDANAAAGAITSPPTQAEVENIRDAVLELADVVGTLIADLQAKNVLG